MKKLLFCIVSVLLTVSMLCLPLFSAAGEGAPAKTTYILGDADGDGEVSIIDVTLMQRLLAYLNDASAFDPLDFFSDEEEARAFGIGMMTRGDVDRDGDMTIIDVTHIMRYLAGLCTYSDVGIIVEVDDPVPTEEPTAEIEPTDAEPTQAPPTIAPPTEAPTTVVTPTVAPTQRPTTKPDPYELPPI